MSSETLRASEIGQFRFCARAWWYARNGEPSANWRELEAGSQAHRSQARGVQRWRAVRRFAQVVVLVGIVLIVLQLAAGSP